MNWEDNFKNVQQQLTNDNNISGYDNVSNFNSSGNNYEESYANNNYGGLDGMEKKYTLCDDMAKQQINRKMLDREMIASKGLPSHSNIQSFNSGIPTIIGWERPSSSCYVEKKSNIDITSTMFDEVAPRGRKVFDRCDKEQQQYQQPQQQSQQYQQPLQHNQTQPQYNQPQYNQPLQQNQPQLQHFQTPLNERPQTNTRKVSTMNEKMDNFHMFKSTDYYK